MPKAFYLFSLPLTLTRFVREARVELKKVAWPTRQTTIRYTTIVIVSSIIIGLIIGAVDYLLTHLIEAVIRFI